MSIVSFYGSSRPSRARFFTKRLEVADIGNLQEVIDTVNGEEQDASWDTGICGWVIRCSDAGNMIHVAYEEDELVFTGTDPASKTFESGRTFALGEIGQINIQHANRYNTNQSHKNYNLYFRATDRDGNNVAEIFSIELYADSA